MVSQLRSTRKRLCTRRQIPEDESARIRVAQDLEKSPILRLPPEVHSEIFTHLDTLNDAKNLAVACKRMWVVFEASIGVLVRKHFLSVELEFLNVHRPNFLLKAQADELVRCGAIRQRRSRSTRTKEDNDEYKETSTQYTFFPVEDATGSIVDHRLDKEPKVYRLPELRRLLANRKLADSVLLNEDGRTLARNLHSSFESKAEVIPFPDDKIIEGIPRELQIQMKRIPRSDYTLPDGLSPEERNKYLETIRIRNCAVSATEISRFRHALFSLANLQRRSIAHYTRHTALRKVVSHLAFLHYGELLALSFRDLFFMRALLSAMSFYSRHWLTGTGADERVTENIFGHIEFRLSKLPESLRHAWHSLPHCCFWDKNSELLESALKVFDGTAQSTLPSWYQPAFSSCASVGDIQKVLKELKAFSNRSDYPVYNYYGRILRPYEKLVFLNNSGEIHLRSDSGPMGVKIGGRTAEFYRPSLVSENFLQRQLEKFPKHRILASNYDMEEIE